MCSVLLSPTPGVMTPGSLVSAEVSPVFTPLKLVECSLDGAPCSVALAVGFDPDSEMSDVEEKPTTALKLNCGKYRLKEALIRLLSEGAFV